MIIKESWFRIINVIGKRDSADRFGNPPSQEKGTDELVSTKRERTYQIYSLRRAGHSQKAIEKFLERYP